MPYTALKKFTVLDLSNRLAGSFCAKTLGLYGCEVIKIEPPSGDLTRKWSDSPNSCEPGDSPLFHHLNAGKKSVTLNIDSPEGRDILGILIQKSGVLIETFQPGRMESLGFSYKSISDTNPGLIMTSVTPYGQTGPHSEFDYTELTVFAMSGAMHREGLPNRYPIRYGAEVAQYYSGNLAAAATVSALLKFLRKGKGDWLDISIQECMAGHPHQIGRRAPFIYSGELDPREQPRISASGTREPYAVGTFRCKDGFMSFLPLGARMWPNIARMIDREDLISNPLFENSDKRTANRIELESIFQGWLNERTRQEIFEAIQEAGIPGSPILRSDEVMENEQFLNREYFTLVDHPQQGQIKLTGDPFRLSAVDKMPLRPAPLLGEHTEQVLTETIGIDTNQVMSLRERGIV